MGLIVQKFGGTSVADAERIRRASRRIIRTREQGHKVVVVVSARGNTTDELYGLAYELSSRPPKREMDMLVSTGEQMSVALMAIAIHHMGHDAIGLTGPQIGIRTDSFHTRAKIIDIHPERLVKELENGRIVIVAGFQGVDPEDNITTLGRGGSDTTAVALAAALKADLCEIYTDVDGVYTADPRIVPDARKMDRISYDEMLELTSAGVSVMHSRAMEFAKNYSVPLHVRTSFSEVEGTIICEEVPEMEDLVVRGTALEKKEAKITIRGVSDHPGIAAAILKSLAKSDINVDMIVQNVSEESTTDFTFTVSESVLDEALDAIQQIKDDIGAKGITSDRNIGKVSVVGVGMRSHSGVAVIMFQALADADINIQMISTSEIKISVVVDRSDADRALRVVHKAFGLDEIQQQKEKS